MTERAGLSGAQESATARQGADSTHVSQIELDFAERVVMECGRPVLMVPAFGDFHECGNRVLVGWNAKREAARAAFDAVPILKSADSVHVIRIGLQEEGFEGPELRAGSELVAALARHGVFGDAIRTILQSMTIPVLMSH